MLKRMIVTMATLAVTQLAAATDIERIEPGNWWVGMKSGHLQLMVHGTDIADTVPEIDYPEVQIETVTRVANRNYLFIDLRISPNAQAGTVMLHFRHGSKDLQYTYSLLQRSPDSATRRGFGNEDVILNLMPDRFANGDPTNDNQPGYFDQANRSSNAAGRHGGDIKGISDHLDYISGLGYTMIWPTPLVENNQKAYSYHGYAATDTYKIDPRYGSNEDFKNMVTLARQKGIGVIQDIVLNHIGSEHWWMKDMPMNDWISFNGQFVPTKHAHSVIGDPYASEEDRKNFTQGWFSDNMPDMNQKNPLVATYQIQNSIWWVEYAGLSGLRIDTYGYSDTAFLSEWSRRLTEEYPNMNMVGEEWSLNPATVAYWQKGKIHSNGYVSYLPSLMDFPLQDAMRTAMGEAESDFTGLVKLYQALGNDNQYPDPDNLVLFEGNHDLSRLYTVLHNDAELVRLAITYVATAPRIPQFYYGTEVLMTSEKERNDGETRKDFPGGWPHDAVNAFTGKGLNKEQIDTQNYMRKLLQWRKNQPVIHHGKMLHYLPENGTYAFFRYDQKHIIMVVLNKNKTETVLKTKRFHEILTGHHSAFDVMRNKDVDITESLTVPARSALVLEIK
ncbi:glycoside hydrolase family 13 protein [Undibacterium sp. SXout20W]|uniref:glycoside hydrolase family 13 protein n=1 Tax=Undibacterium sp. SXout20W TaxID=3413051 RepID=UPI003BF10FC5